jgi:hypothetical protein
MRAANRSSLLVWVGAAICLAGALYWTMATRLTLNSTVFATGYTLFALMVFLALYNGRKKLSMVPLGRASVWLTLHVVGGVAGVVLFWIHTGVLWPEGFVDQALTALFYLVALSGLFGYGIQIVIPGRLARTGRETIYERIPADLAKLRREVEDEILAAAGESGHDTLGRYYVETLAWYFERPRFVLSNAFGGRRSDHWLRQQIDTVGRYLSDEERKHLARIAELGRVKSVIDTQYALQSVLKRWPLIHVPLAAAMMTLATWHLILMHVFGR